VPPLLTNPCAASGGIPAGPPAPAPGVLVVDDDPAVRGGVRAILVRAGYRVFDAATRGTQRISSDWSPSASGRPSWTCPCPGGAGPSCCGNCDGTARISRRCP
jgi:hypothetical protein